MNEQILEKLNKIEQLTLLAAKNVLNIDDVALLTDLSKSTLYKLTSNREIPHYKKNNLLFFDRTEVESWMKSVKIDTVEDINDTANSYIARTTGNNGRKRGGLK